MRAVILTFFGILLSAQVFAQTDNVTLLAQSVDGRSVKLFWFIRHWNSSYTGFDIKRKEGLQNWVKLNSEPILPGISAKKKLTVSAGVNRYEESLLKAKLNKMIRSRQVQETDYNKYLQKLNKDDSALREISAVMAEEYDIAIMNGFGYEDNTLAKKTTYQYGLFIQGTDNLLAKVSWNYGEIPNLDVVEELTSKASAGNKGIKIIWIADTAKMKAARVAGFNIYRSGIRLNSARITIADTSDPSVYAWYDRSADNANSIQYSIGAESVFDIEGIIKSYIYDPAEHTKDYKQAQVTEIAPLGYYFKEGTSTKWAFPKEYEHYIKGFEIEKDNVPGGYKQVSGLLDPSLRAFTDKTLSQVNGYIKFRVNVIYKDRTNVPGIERLYYYFPVAEPLPPRNVTVKKVLADKKVTAYFSWDPPLAGDSITDGYKLYAYDDANNKLNPVTDQQITTNSCTYTIQHGTAAIHKFCITSLSRAGNESPFSDTVSVQIPSLELPVPLITQVAPDNNNKALITWQYPDIPDLKGFRLFQNDKMIADENELKKNTREFTTGKLDEGASYEFKIIAISDIGILSEYSASFHVVVTQTSVK